MCTYPTTGRAGKTLGKSVGEESRRGERIWADAAEVEEWDTHLAYRRKRDSKEGAKHSNWGMFAGLSAAKYSSRACQAASLPVPPSRIHFFNHGCFHSHPYSPNVKLGKKWSAPDPENECVFGLIYFISTANIHIFPTSSFYLGLTSRSFTWAAVVTPHECLNRG